MTAISPRIRGLVLLAVGLTWTVLPSPSHAVCLGDCNSDGQVAVSELVLLVNMALDKADMSQCGVADTDSNGKISVSELVAAVNSALSGCSGTVPTPTATPGCTQSFNSTYEAIQKVVFENHGCTSTVCHGKPAKQQGLDLSPDVAYENLFGKPSTEVTMNLITPGDKTRSYLWLKLAAATDPSMLEGFQIAGAAMPNGLAPLSANELKAMRLWIAEGAPKTGTVPETEGLLNACLPPAEPIDIEPLAAPADGTGVQFAMPPWHLEAHSEHEICFATYYDITDQVPEEFQDPTHTMFRFASNELRQDPSSHHLILNRYFGPEFDLHDASFGGWTCDGGDKDGQTCEPSDLTACGSGFCRSAIRQSFACIGFGPGGGQHFSVGGAQASQSYNDYVDGVFAQIPMKGVLYWNSHAFNLTNKDTTMHAWLNYYFANDQRFPVRGIFDASHIFSANAAPFTTQTICNDFVLPKGANLFNLSSHTHRHGKDFTIMAPDGTKLYESFVYNDPVDKTFDPPLVFNGATAKDRTLHYCSLYNNGVKADNSPDVELVTKSSHVPPSAQLIGNCSPVACVAGKIGAKCNGKNDDRTCDSSPGAGDGDCDACNITGGESTENEMFILIGAYYIGSNGGAGEGADVDASGRSTFSDVALPQVRSCSSGSGHAGHVASMAASSLSNE